MKSLQKINFDSIEELKSHILSNLEGEGNIYSFNIDADSISVFDEAYSNGTLDCSDIVRLPGKHINRYIMSVCIPCGEKSLFITMVSSVFSRFDVNCYSQVTADNSNTVVIKHDTPSDGVFLNVLNKSTRDGTSIEFLCD